MSPHKVTQRPNTTESDIPTGADVRFRQALSRVVFRDGAERIRLCDADLTLVNLARWMALAPATLGRSMLTRIELPRGSHDVAVMFAIVAQLGRRWAEREDDAFYDPVRGSVLVVGTDTNVQARLASISIQGTPLNLGLTVYRVRGDGRIVTPARATLSFQPGRGELLYLNTRVGWPRLAGERDGLTVIDRTSFVSPELLERALRWSHDHYARHIVILHDHGDQEAIAACDAAMVIDAGTLAAQTPPVTMAAGTPPPASGLSLVRLVGGSTPRLGAARVLADEIESLSASIHGHLVVARQVAERLPYPLFAAGQLLASANWLAGRVLTHDQVAALAPRGRPIRDLARVVADAHGFLDGPFAGFRETRYAALRADVLRLIELIEADNPKYAALIYLLDSLRRRSPRPRVIVRAADEGAALALEEDILWFDPDLRENTHFVALRRRLPWDPRNTVEVLVGLPPPWNRQMLWSGEARERIVLAYGWEAAVLRRIVAQESERTRTLAPLAFSRVISPISAAPDIFRYEHRAKDARTSAAVPSFDIDLIAVIADDEMTVGPDDLDGMATTPETTRTGLVLAHAVVLEPDGAVWWAPADAEVEVVSGPSLLHLRPTDLRPGMEVIVPRGSGRESLFSRALSMVESRESYLDADFILGRWRRACRELLARAGTAEQAQALLREAECTTITQLEQWAEGRTLAPNDPNDMARVAHLAEDEWLRRNWRRVAALVTQVRGTHIRIGQTISAAMREAAEGGGPHLDALAELLDMDAASLLDEFDIRVVDAISTPQHVLASLAGSVRLSSSAPIQGRT